MLLFAISAHSPDNSFMGFVVEEHLNESESLAAMEKKDQAVVYGKAEYMWQVCLSVCVSVSLSLCLYA